MPIFNYALSRSLLGAVLLFAALFSASASADANLRLQLLPSGADDLQAVELRSAPSAPWQHAEREPVSVALALAAESALAPERKPSALDSREYWRSINGAELRKGVALTLSADGALLRLSARARGTAVRADDFHMRNSQGQNRALPELAQTLLHGSEANSALLPLTPGALALRVNAKVGAGAWVLHSPAFADADEFLLQVYEPNSDYRLRAQHSAGTVLLGQPVQAELSLLQNDTALALQQIRATLVAPDGKRRPLRVQRQGRRYFVAQTVDTQSNAPGLWEIEWQAKARAGGLNIERGLRTPFALATPTARWQPELFMQRSNTGTALQIPLSVQSAGRYELRAIVSGRNGQGQHQPLLMSSTAAWLEPGSHTLALPLDRAVLQEAGASGDLQVQELQLIDQSRLAVIQHQAQALSLTEAQWR